MNTNTLQYTDENDRALGMAGMMISLAIWDARHLVVDISLDRPAGDGVTLAPEFAFAGNPQLSARVAWQQMVRQLEISSAMVLGNVMCRAYVGRRKRPTSATTALTRALVRDEAINVCMLDDDETDNLYQRVADTLERAFTRSDIADVARSFAARLIAARAYTAAEAADTLAALGLR